MVRYVVRCSPSHFRSFSAHSVEESTSCEKNGVRWIWGGKTNEVARRVVDVDVCLPYPLKLNYKPVLLESAKTGERDGGREGGREEAAEDWRTGWKDWDHFASRTVG